MRIGWYMPWASCLNLLFIFPINFSIFISLLIGLYIENYCDGKIANLVNGSQPVINNGLGHLKEEKFY